MWISSSSTICWKDLLYSIVLHLLLCQRSGDSVYVGLFLHSSIDLLIYLSVSHFTSITLYWLLFKDNFKLFPEILSMIISWMTDWLLGQCFQKWLIWSELWLSWIFFWHKSFTTRRIRILELCSLLLHSIYWKSAQSCLTLCNPIDCNLPVGFSIHGIFQVRILEWVAIPFSRGSSQPGDQTQVSLIAGRFFTLWATREAQEYWSG